MLALPLTMTNWHCQAFPSFHLSSHQDQHSRAVPDTDLLVHYMAIFNYFCDIVSIR